MFPTVRPYLFLWLVLAFCVGASGKKPGVEDLQRRAEIDHFFAAGPIPSLDITIPPDQLEKLKKDARVYVEATLSDGQQTIEKVAIKLKGSAGSFQPVEAKPGFTISLEKFGTGQTFHGMEKFHLNNGAQDGTYLNEQMAGEMGRAAGVPASRCTHAFVKLNGRDLGTYVIKEAFNKDFLAAFFKHHGDLWDGGFCHEIDVNMQKDLGDPADKEPIKQLIAACQENDSAKRWAKLEAILDVDRYASFCVMEDFLCHWDGYNFNRNNYRLYRDVDTGKMCFFLHGMDQMFNDANFPISRDFGSMVGNAYMRCPEGALLYHQRADELYEKVIKATDWAARTAQAGERVRQALLAIDPNKAKDYEGRINDARSRVSARVVAIGKQLGDWPKPPEFDKDNILKLADHWQPQPNGDSTLLEAERDGRKALHIAARSASSGSWRQTLNLPPGKYRFEARVLTAAVQPTVDGRGHGADLRISGGNAQQFVEGDSPWKTLAYEFDSTGAPVALVAELRAQKGEAWFERESLRVVRLK